MSKLKILTVFLVLSINILAGELNGNGIKNIYQLSDFGKSGTVQDAANAMEKAVAEITAKGGGTLFINSETCSDFVPESAVQKSLGKNSVTIIDIRGGKFRYVLPSLGYRVAPDPFGYASIYMDRQVNQETINANGVNSILRMSNRLVNGSVSYFQPVRGYEKESDPETMRVYLATVKGVAPGMEMTAMMGQEKESYSERSSEFAVNVRIEKLGWDSAKKLHFAIIRKLDAKTPWHPVTWLVNKATVNAMTIYESTSCDVEEAGTIQIEKHAFGQGDNFGIGMRFCYMGNVMSTGGDENGNAYTVDIWQLLFSFIGKVESWDASSGKLVYTPDSQRANTLGTSRLMINLNPSKWITRGKISVESEFSETGEIDPKCYVRGINTNWTTEIIGRAIAIDTPEEYAGNPPEGFWKSALKGRKVRRWWLITNYEKTASGEDRLWVERIRHLVYNKSVPTLINESNYRRELPYIIAPCAMVADVSKGILKEHKMELKGDSIMPGKDDKRIIVLAPSPDTGTKFDFEPGDSIEQAVGADPSHPNGYRVRHREAMPTCNSNSSSYYTINNGAYPVFAALAVHGGHDKMQIPGHSKFFNAVDVSATCDYGIRFRNTIKNAAVFMEMPEHKIAWKTPSGNVALSANEKGCLNIDSSGLSLDSKPVTEVGGISATSSAAKNLRGINVPVKKGTTRQDVAFSGEEVSAEYSLIVQPSWLSRCAVVTKRKDGFTVIFDVAPEEDSTIDWLMVR